MLSASCTMNLPSAASSNAQTAFNMRRLKLHAQAVESERHYVRALDEAWHSFGHHFISCCPQRCNQQELSLLLLETRRIWALSSDLIEALGCEPHVVAEVFLDWLALAQPVYDDYVYRYKKALDLFNSAQGLSYPFEKAENLSYHVCCYAADVSTSKRTQYAATVGHCRSSSHASAMNNSNSDSSSGTLKHLLRLPVKRIGWLVIERLV